MRSLLRAAITSSLIVWTTVASAQTYTIPDPAFANVIHAHVPFAISGNVLQTMHPDVLSLNFMNANASGITNLDGLQFFTGLTVFGCIDNALSTLPSLPSSLHELNCSGNQITGLPQLPPALQILEVYDNQITALPDLPPTLTALSCSNNPLTSLPALNDGLIEIQSEHCLLTTLPALPQTLDRIYCDFNQITSLPPLPSNLTFLFCYDNQLANLPILPNTLTWLRCQNNLLTTLPNMPDSIQFVGCDHNQITHLPSMAGSALVQFMCFNNQLQELPELPPSLFSMWCNDNPLKCLPVLPNALANFNCTNTLVTCLPNMPLSFDSTMFWADFPAHVCDVAHSGCAFREETISGIVFNDLDGDGARDIGEPPFLLGTVEAQPGDFLTGPDPSGYYVLHVDTGTFIFQGQPVLYHTRTTDPGTAALELFEEDTLRDIGYQIIPGMYDVVADLAASQPQAGLINPVTLGVLNVGTETTTATISFTFDADQEWFESDSVPVSLIGHEAIWSATLQPGGLWRARVYLRTDSTVVLGTPIEQLLIASIPQTDQTPDNNIDTDPSTVLGSMDPNDKVVRPVALTPEQLLAGENVEYTIRFQNTGTAAAQRVVITDTLSTDLEWGSLQFVSSSHPCTWFLANGVLYVVFDPIALPDSSTDEPNSHGHVRFSVRPDVQLMIGETVSNNANIFFDFNAPVTTNTCLLAIDPFAAVAEVGVPQYLRIVPDPFTVEAHVFFGDPLSPDDRVDLVDVQGRVRKSLSDRTGDELLIRRDGLANGLYVLRVIKDGVCIAATPFVVE